MRIHKVARHIAINVGRTSREFGIEKGNTNTDRVSCTRLYAFNRIVETIEEAKKDLWRDTTVSTCPHERMDYSKKFVILIYPACRYIAPTKLYTIVIFQDNRV